MREIIYEEVSKEMKIAKGEMEIEVLEMTEAVPKQYEESEEEKMMGTKTAQNMKMLKKTLMVGTLIKN